MTTIAASSRKGKLVLTCNVCKAEKIYDGMVAQVVIERFIKSWQKEGHVKCADEAKSNG
jgi:hypothetical protein